MNKQGWTTVLVHAGCYNEITQTRWLVNNGNMSPFWRPEVCDQGGACLWGACLEWGRGMLPGCRCSVTVSSGRAGTRELPWVSFLREHHCHGLITFVVLPINTSACKISTPALEGGHKHSDHNNGSTPLLFTFHGDADKHHTTQLNV